MYNGRAIWIRLIGALLELLPLALTITLRAPRLDAAAIHLRAGREASAEKQAQHREELGHFTPNQASNKAFLKTPAGAISYCKTSVVRTSGVTNVTSQSRVC